MTFNGAAKMSSASWKGMTSPHDTWETKCREFNSLGIK